VDTWTRWRGSPEHVAQVARIAAETMGASTTCRIVVAKGPYRESFDSVQAFRDGLTAEALRDFSRIAILVKGSGLCVFARFRRLAPVVVILLVVGFALILRWLRPSVEVAPLGQTRLWKMTRYAGPVVVGIVAAGIGKLVFG